MDGRDEETWQQGSSDFPGLLGAAACIPSAPKGVVQPDNACRVSLPELQCVNSTLPLLPEHPIAPCRETPAVVKGEDERMPEKMNNNETNSPLGCALG